MRAAANRQALVTEMGAAGVRHLERIHELVDLIEERLGRGQGVEYLLAEQRAELRAFVALQLRAQPSELHQRRARRSSPAPRLRVAA